MTIEEEIVPASNNTNIQISKFFDDNKGDDEDIANSGNFNEFDHSRNISLDDTTITDLHRRENSINPPTGLPHSISSNTIYPIHHLNHHNLIFNHNHCIHKVIIIKTVYRPH